MDWELLPDCEKDNLMRLGAAVLREWPKLPEKVQDRIVSRATELPHRPLNAMQDMRNFIRRWDGENRRPPRTEED